MYEVTFRIRRTDVTDFRTWLIEADHAVAAMNHVTRLGKDVVELKRVG